VPSRLVIRTKEVINNGEIVQTLGDLGVIGSEPVLLDRERSPRQIERLRLARFSSTPARLHEEVQHARGLDRIGTELRLDLREQVARALLRVGVATLLDQCLEVVERGWTGIVGQDRQQSHTEQNRK
jgi:hypothetical protein